MRSFFSLAFALTVLVPWTAPARAAEKEVKLVPEEGAVEVMLLRQHSVRKELKLTDDEAEKIHKFTSQQWKKAQHVSALGEKERDRKFDEMTKENERFLEETLTKDQKKRLDQITLQVAGLLCVTRPHVASKLKLTSEQKKRAPQLQKEARDEMEELIHSTSDGEKQEKLSELRQTSKKRLLELLTDEQESEWKKMTGAPFKGDLHFDFSNEEVK
ncbi:MAG TPA: hypothetical protein VMV69_12150 [Pirellulales bacterium]|nr:hypothetical protein [Pirellulales bacterium]